MRMNMVTATQLGPSGRYRYMNNAGLNVQVR